ncbi:YCF48-related protein [Hymenobacter sp. ASUV-10]|uniref:YCF48-related protein n=1 Tax=Hymenobacter aranciens TaxID=3063996 RepID=A0ABT9B8H1_9BACT|nr:YCF48-related protein [Hymenobacter sp. ASUV-10]MDO7874535.1 YCF48-related protein [Hymenobacter sp. ASUV-10]
MRRFLLLLSLAVSATAAPAQTWTTQRPPAGLFALTDVHFTDASHGYASAAVGGLLKTMNGGQTWASLPSGVPSSLRDVHFSSADSGYVVGNVGVVIRTVDGGASWQRHDLANNGASVNGVYSHSSRRALVTQGDQIFRTTNGGQTWTVAYTYNGALPIFTFRFLEFVTPSLGYAVGGYAGSMGGTTQVVKTTDGGATWTLLPNLVAGGTAVGPAAAVAFPTAQHGYVADVNRRLFRTTDGGQTWTLAGQNNFGSFYGMHFVGPSTGYGVGDTGNIQYTTDGGQTWTAQGTNTDDTYANVYFPAPTVGYAVGSDAGAGPRVLKFTNPMAIKPAGPLAGLVAYPNPATTAVQLPPLPASLSGQATLLAADGRVVLRQPLRAATASALLTASLPAGLYVLRIEAGQYATQQKLMVK